MTIRGLLFDKDGTLLDYGATWMPVNRAAARAAAGGEAALEARLLRAGGYDAARDRVRANSPLAVGNTVEIAESWIGHLPEWRRDDLVALLDRVFQAEGRLSTVPVPGLASVLGRLKARGLMLGVATSDSEKGIEATLSPLGVVEMFDFRAGYDSGHGVKPGPGMVRAFCVASGLDPAAIAVVGDSLHDLAMGRAAGAGLVVGVLTGTGTRGELAAYADHVLDSIAELEALLDRV